MPNTDHQSDQHREEVQSSALARAVSAEIEALHVFLAEWFRGEPSNDDDVFVTRFARRFDPGFVLIGPGGTINPLAQVSKQIRASHGVSPTIEIEIREFTLRRELGDGVVVATYEEWQRNASHARGPGNARISTVLLRADRVATGGFAWLHLHECWLPSAH